MDQEWKICHADGKAVSCLVGQKEMATAASVMVCIYKYCVLEEALFEIEGTLSFGMFLLDIYNRK